MISRLITTLRSAAVIFLCATGIAHAADAVNANYQPAPPQSPAWLASVAGTKLVAVDGSTITLTPTEGGLSLILQAPNGAAQKSTFAFMSDKLGTISDDSDLGHVIGFFRETDAGMEAQFADGRTESLVANTAGGISLTLHNSTTESSCTSWYPPDHVFGAAEKRAALAAYADRLGIADHGKNAPRATASCVPAVRVIKTKDRPATARNAAPLLTISHPAATAPSAETPVKGSAALIPVVVRSSEVHLIDNAAAAAFAKSPAKPSSAPPTPAPQLIQASLQQTVPAAPPAAPLQTATASVPPGSGASECLSVETNGADVGFRNRCAYGVQFAYCLQKGSDPSVTCDAGTKTGTIAANGFAAVLQDAGIKSAEADHDFRWVACSGNTNDVVAHLDHANPPAGRCIKASAS
jgi:hypothetical protein